MTPDLVIGLAGVVLDKACERCLNEIIKKLEILFMGITKNRNQNMELFQFKFRFFYFCFYYYYVYLPMRSGLTA
jgi:hypothetical protein